MQAIARVNRSRKGKDAGFIVDYNGITDSLLDALKIFSGDLRPEDILKNIASELPQLAMHHTQLVDFFKPLHVDRKYERARYLDKAIQYLEPLDRRDTFKDLLKQFNKSVGIVLPDTRAMPFFDDFKLFNELKMRARNVYPGDQGFKISKEESQLILGLIDAHLTSTGVRNLLEEPVPITDRERFRQEMNQASPATQELKMRNHLKHTIKVRLDKNPDFYRPLAERLEQLIQEHEAGRLSQLSLLLEQERIQDEIIRSVQESADKGFITKQQQAVLASMKTIFTEEETDAEDATRTVFDLIEGELSIVGWKDKGKVINDMENKLTRYLQVGMARPEAKQRAKELVEVLLKN